MARGLIELENAKLISVERISGQPSIVTIIDVNQTKG
jgi:hypothetical protein